MTRFGVWAPKAREVEVETLGRRYPMRSFEHGWWFAEVASIDGNSDYKFVLDAGEALPDPRSAWQPRGIHGPSRTIDHKALQWTDGRWQAGPLSSAVIYELHVGTFTQGGDFFFGYF